MDPDRMTEDELAERSGTGRECIRQLAPRTRPGTCFRTRFRSTGRCRSGDEPTGLLRSAEQLLRRVTTPGAGSGLYGLRAQVADLVWEANTGVGG